MTFETLYQQVPTETQNERALRRLARDYHEKTEAFDRAICQTLNERGVAIPIRDQIRKCAAFAREERDYLGIHAAYLGFDSRAWDAAIASEARSFDADWDNGMYRDDPRFNGAGFLPRCISAT